MKFSIKTGPFTAPRTDCLVAGVFEGRKLSAAGDEIERASGGYVSRILGRGDLEGKKSSVLLLHDVPGVKSDRILLLGLGKIEEFDESTYRAAIAEAAKALLLTGAARLRFSIAGLRIGGRDTAFMASQVIFGLSEGFYQFDKFKSRPPEHQAAVRVLEIHLGGDDIDLSKVRAMALRAIAIADGITTARNLGNLPANVCTPTFLAGEARSIAQNHGLKCTVIDRKGIEKLGMGAFLAVAQGSSQPPKLIVIKYQGARKRNSRPFVLVGKGVTFDTGGISLKPAQEMDEMKFDMCGAASVLGTLKSLAMMKLSLNVIGIIPATENMPGGSAIKPGDIVRTMSGQTVEILNTDAEGRLILCDALTFAERFNPAGVVDIATLTGAMVIALGHVATGFFANDDSLSVQLLEAGNRVWDRAWRLPLWADYQEALKSNFADLPNIGSRAGGAITAACFLSRFAKRYPWAHLDIAGTAWKSGADKGATGRPVALLSQFLIEQST